MLAEKQKLLLKKILEEDLSEIKGSIVELKKSIEPVSPDNAIGRLSRMDALEMQSVNTLKLERQYTRVNQLNLALKRIQSDEDFGVCLECDQVINIERLKLSPESRYCVACLQAGKSVN